jgi:hypothetical protein
MARHVAVQDVVTGRQVDRAGIRVGVADLELEAVDVSAVRRLDDEGVRKSALECLGTPPTSGRW